MYIYTIYIYVRPIRGHESPEGVGWVLGDLRHAPAVLPPVPLVQKAGWASGQVLDGCGKSRPYRI
jgi:hypothetical protein